MFSLLVYYSYCSSTNPRSHFFRYPQSSSTKNNPKFHLKTSSFKFIVQQKNQGWIFHLTKKSRKMFIFFKLGFVFVERYFWNLRIIFPPTPQLPLPIIPSNRVQYYSNIILWNSGTSILAGDSVWTTPEILPHVSFWWCFFSFFCEGSRKQISAASPCFSTAVWVSRFNSARTLGQYCSPSISPFYNSISIQFEGCPQFWSVENRVGGFSPLLLLLFEVKGIPRKWIPPPSRFLESPSPATGSRGAPPSPMEDLDEDLEVEVTPQEGHHPFVYKDRGLSYLSSPPREGGVLFYVYWACGYPPPLPHTHWKLSLPNPPRPPKLSWISSLHSPN